MASNVSVTREADYRGFEITAYRRDGANAAYPTVTAVFRLPDSPHFVYYGPGSAAAVHEWIDGWIAWQQSRKDGGALGSRAAALAL